MKVHRGFPSLSPDRFERPVATIGVFDGVHLGHRAVLDATRDLAREVGGETVVVTFETHPSLTIKGHAPDTLTSVPHRLVLLDRAGVDHAVVLPFDEEIRTILAREFADRVFLDGLGVKGLVLGYDSHFGRGREGDLEFVRRWAEGKDIVVRSAPPILVMGKPVSSSVIRAAIARGEHDTAQAMLGRPVAVYGRVVRGSGRGRELGFATANLDVLGELCPPNGVYAAWARLSGNWHPAMVNIGRRPTFDPVEAPVRIEVHIPGLDRDLYGEEMEVQFLRRIRDEMRFADAGELVAQLEQDRLSLDRIVAEAKAPPARSGAANRTSGAPSESL